MAMFLSAVGVLLAVALFFAGWALTYSTTAMESFVVSDVPVIQGDAAPTGLRVEFQGQPVQSLRAYEVRFTNVGTEPIEAGHYEKPITVTSSSGARFLQSEGKSAPAGADVRLRMTGEAVVIEPLLLNSGESVSINLVTTADQPGDLEVEARIAGVKGLIKREVIPYDPAADPLGSAFGGGPGVTSTDEDSVLTLFLVAATFVAFLFIGLVLSVDGVPAHGSPAGISLYLFVVGAVAWIAPLILAFRIPDIPSSVFTFVHAWVICLSVIAAVVFLIPHRSRAL